MTDTPPPPKRESSDDRRAAIAAAARALVHEKGFEGLRTRDIAERVGINIATLHYHVPSKAALIQLLAETMQDDFRHQSLARPRAHLSGAEQLEYEFADYLELLTAQQQLLEVMSELTQRAARDPAIAAVLRPMRRGWEAMVADIFRTGVADGSFRRDLDPAAAALLLIGALSEFRRGTDRSPENYERLCAELRRAFRPPSSEPRP